MSSDDFDRADSRVDADRVAPRLIAALIRMESGDRDALLLFAWQELTYKEIGVALGIPAGTVGSRISRARQRLRVSLGETGDDRMGAV